MSEGAKIRVAVIYGGRSSEHEVSLWSAASVIRHLDPNRFEVIPIGIDKTGRWRLGVNPQPLQGPSAQFKIKIDSSDREIQLLPAPGSKAEIVPLGADRGGGIRSVDVVFPVMHGTNCEDGAIQGFLELMDVAYVGCGVLASAVGMDKDVAKRLCLQAGIPVVPSVTLHASDARSAQAQSRIEKEIGFPCFVKPANLGSSVGVHKVKERADLQAALADAFLYDHKVLVEKAIDAREIELAALESADPAHPAFLSIPGEIVPTHEFYSYEAKYLDENGAKLLIPAELSEAQVKTAQALGARAFATLECQGMARVDLFMDRASGAFYFNEVNTIPGFTSISMYPKLMEASGVPYPQLLARLVDLALARQRRKHALKTDYSSKP